mmetsp:Transcript_8101/g.9240  ORF Transcript_8101/g.9240 Transcript_8101/m.9240 type:complete len:270 (+) Transcript_8101:2639-3448(+)
MAEVKHVVAGRALGRLVLGFVPASRRVLIVVELGEVEKAARDLVRELPSVNTELVDLTLKPASQAMTTLHDHAALARIIKMKRQRVVQGVVRRPVRRIVVSQQDHDVWVLERHKHVVLGTAFGRGPPEAARPTVQGGTRRVSQRLETFLAAGLEHSHGTTAVLLNVLVVNVRLVNQKRHRLHKAGLGLVHHTKPVRLRVEEVKRCRGRLQSGAVAATRRIPTDARRGLRGIIVQNCSVQEVVLLPQVPSLHGQDARKRDQYRTHHGENL